MSTNSHALLDQELEAARVGYYVALVEAANAKLALLTADRKKIGSEAYAQLDSALQNANNRLVESAVELQELLICTGPLTRADFALSQFIEISFAFQHALELLQQPEVNFADTYLAKQDVLRLNILPGPKMAATFNYDYVRRKFRDLKGDLVFCFGESEKPYEVLISAMLSAENIEADVEYALTEYGWQDEGHFDMYVERWEGARAQFCEALTQLVAWRCGA